MTNQFSFADIFGEQFAVAEPEKKESKKETAKKETKKATTKAKKVSLTLPCRVRSNSFDIMVEGEGEVTGEELIKKLFDLGYTEVASAHKALFTYENDAFIIDSAKVAVADDTIVDLSNTVTFCFGMKKLYYSADDFEGEDEVTVADIKAKVIDSMPEFANHDFGYDIESNTIVVLMKNEVFNTGKVTVPCTVNVCGEDVTIDEIDGDDCSALKKAALSELITVKGMNVKVYSNNGDTPYYFIQFSVVSKNDRVSANGALKSNKGKETKKKEKKYNLPVSFYISMNGIREELTSETFGGKEKVTEKDITAYYSDKFLWFQSAEKVKDLKYVLDTITNTLTVSCSPGVRG